MFEKFATTLLFFATTTLLLLATATFSHAHDQHIFKFDQVKWTPAGLDGAEMAILWGSESEGNAVWAFRLQPGVAIPAHTHSVDYWGFAIQGKWAHIDRNDRVVVTGQDAYVLIKGGELHADKCMGPEVCINIIQFKGPRDIQFPQVRSSR
jgi:hypothetical protein